MGTVSRGLLGKRPFHHSILLHMLHTHWSRILQPWDGQSINNSILIMYAVARKVNSGPFRKKSILHCGKTATQLMWNGCDDISALSSTLTVPPKLTHASSNVKHTSVAATQETEENQQRGKFLSFLMMSESQIPRQRDGWTFQ